jgi:hypothetical protein
MIDPNIIRMLSSNSSERRKQAIMLLAKSGEPDALSYLEETAETDETPQLRQLARRGIAYLKDNIHEEEDFDYDDSLFEGVDVERESLLPTDFDIPNADAKIAQTLIDKALDHNVRGNNAEATILLREAFKINPVLMYDDYVRHIAANITGRESHEAIRTLSPSMDDLRLRLRGRPEIHPAQRFSALLVLISAIVTLLGVFLYPWADISSVPVTNIPAIDIGDEATLGSIEDRLHDLVYSAETSLVIQATVGPNKHKGIQNAVDGITLKFGWIDAVRVFTGLDDVINITGLQTLIDEIQDVNTTIPGIDLHIDGAAIHEELTHSIQPRPVSSWDVTLTLVPIAAGFAMLIGLLILIKPSIRGWLVCLTVGLMGLLPMMHFYNNAGTLVPQNFNASSIGQILIVPPVGQLVNGGFWLTLAGTLAITVIPILTVLLVPLKDSGQN